MGRTFIDEAGKKQLQERLAAVRAKEKSIAQELSGQRLKSDDFNFLMNQSKEELVQLKQEKGRIKALLENAEVIYPNGGFDVVAVGAVVTLEFDDGVTSEFKFGVASSPGVASISLDAPIAEIIEGKKVGEVITYLAGDEEVSVKIKKIV